MADLDVNVEVDLKDSNEDSIVVAATPTKDAGVETMPIPEVGDDVAPDPTV